MSTTDVNDSSLIRKQQTVVGHARVGHQHFDGTLLLFDGFEGCIEGLRVRHVALNTEEALRWIA